MSPSMRREWIEILWCAIGNIAPVVSPSMRREWIEITCSSTKHGTFAGLPPCGGSGLKFNNCTYCISTLVVSLHAEGVD